MQDIYLPSFCPPPPLPPSNFILQAALVLNSVSELYSSSAYLFHPNTTLRGWLDIRHPGPSIYTVYHNLFVKCDLLFACWSVGRALSSGSWYCLSFSVISLWRACSFFKCSVYCPPPPLNSNWQWPVSAEISHIIHLPKIWITLPGYGYSSHKSSATKSYYQCMQCFHLLWCSGEYLMSLPMQL